MGFTKLRSTKGIINSDHTMEGAIDWILLHQEDDDIDDPLLLPDTKTSPTSPQPNSYKCNECGKISKSMNDLERHTTQSGHTDFEESTTTITPLTPAEQK